jgi:cell division septation protein DedD
MMSPKRPWVSGGQHADPEGRGPPGQHEPATQAPRGRILSVVVPLAALTVFGGIAWYAYDWVGSQFETARPGANRADSGPIESRPESPGGQNASSQDVAVLNDRAPDPENPRFEHLFAPSETPLPTPTESAEAEAMAKPEALAPAAPAAAPLSEPLPEPQSEPLPEPQSEPLSEPLPEPLPEAPVATSQLAALPPATAPAGAYLIQLAALKSGDDARSAWGRLQKAHPALLGEPELAIQEVDLGERGIFYRIQAGYFPDRASALELCNALKARGQDCLVVKR